MHNNDSKKQTQNDADLYKAPGGGTVIHNDPKKRDVYSGANPRMHQPYDYKPSTQMQGTSKSKSSSWEK
ncbi:MAG: hypothetical protein PV340_04265 [Wolbachia sp.]|nr:hypothetical protein [Wolbachia sp.]MDD9336086.1 hypothetical protein [Wolbachia sp.]